MRREREGGGEREGERGGERVVVYYYCNLIIVCGISKQCVILHKNVVVLNYGY